MALFPLPLPPSAGWSLISAGKGQKEGERGTEAGRGNKGRKVGRITHEDEKAGGRTDGEDVDEVGERSAKSVTVWSGDGSIKGARSIWHCGPLTHGANDQPTQPV